MVDKMSPMNSNSQDLHPPRLTRPQRVVQAAAGLLQLPREVVHQIFDDLTVFQVLQLASCRQDYIDDCVLGHPRYCLAFESLEKIAEVRDLFTVFYELRASLDILHPPYDSRLAQNPGYFSVEDWLIGMSNLPSLLNCGIESFLSGMDSMSLNALCTYSKLDPYDIILRIRGAHESQDWRSFIRIWHEISAAEQAINQANCAQLHRIARLFEAYPKFLKRTSDPSQMPRGNTSHIVSYFHSRAEQARKVKWLDQSKHSTRLKSRFSLNDPYLPIIPFDACLRLFCRKTQWESQWKAYPADIISDISTAKADLSYLNVVAEPVLRAPSPEIYRTKFINATTGLSKDPSLSHVVDSEIATLDHWRPSNQNVAGLFPEEIVHFKKNQEWRNGTTPFAESALPDDCWNIVHGHPVFMCPPYRHLGKLFVEKKTGYDPRHWNRYWGQSLPYHEGEFIWLEAFLRVVTYLQCLEDEEHAGELRELSMPVPGGWPGDSEP